MGRKNKKRNLQTGGTITFTALTFIFLIAPNISNNISKLFCAKGNQENNNPYKEVNTITDERNYPTCT